MLQQSTSPVDTPSWRGEWGHPAQQQHHSSNNGYNIINSPMGPSYTPQAPMDGLPRPMLPQQYMVNHQYTAAPAVSIPSPPYHPPAQVEYPAYTHAPHNVISPPQQQLPLSPVASEMGREVAYQKQMRNATVSAATSPTPSASNDIKREMPSAFSPIAYPVSTVSKTITPNIVLNKDLVIDFNTEVDMLMKTIQALPETSEIVVKAEAEKMQDHAYIDEEVPQAEEKSTPRMRVKKHACLVKGCDKRFSQKTHLDIHMFAHTGIKPHQCNMCGKGFTQQGNLRTHRRSHTGEKPYECVQCGKKFAQKGNLTAHLKVHQHHQLKMKPFPCKLGGCSKQFSQLGNLKHHMNRYHKDDLRSIEIRLAKFKASGGDISEEDKEMWKYLATHFKNSNKGIKGRGGRKLQACLAEAHVPQPHRPVVQVPPMQPAGYPVAHQTMPQTPQPLTQGHQSSPYNGIAYSYNAPRPSPMVPQPMGRNERVFYDGYNVNNPHHATNSMYDQYPPRTYVQVTQ